MAKGNGGCNGIEIILNYLGGFNVITIPKSREDSRGGQSVRYENSTLLLLTLKMEGRQQHPRNARGLEVETGNDFSLCLGSIPLPWSGDKGPCPAPSGVVRLSHTFHHTVSDDSN